MRKKVAYGIAIGTLTFASISQISAGPLTLGRSSALQSDFGAAYGIGVKGNLSRLADDLNKVITNLANVLKALEKTNSGYKLIEPERLKELKDCLKTFNALLEGVKLARDSNRKKLEVLADININCLKTLFGSLKDILYDAGSFDESQICDKNALKAKQKRDDAQKALDKAEADLAKATEGLRASVAQSCEGVKAIATGLPNLQVPTLQVDANKISESKALQKTEELFEKTREIAESINSLKEAANPVKADVEEQGPGNSPQENDGIVGEEPSEAGGAIESLEEAPDFDSPPDGSIASTPLQPAATTIAARPPKADLKVAPKEGAKTERGAPRPSVIPQKQDGGAIIGSAEPFDFEPPAEDGGIVSASVQRAVKTMVARSAKVDDGVASKEGAKTQRGTPQPSAAPRKQDGGAKQAQSQRGVSKSRTVVTDVAE